MKKKNQKPDKNLVSKPSSLPNNRDEELVEIPFQEEFYQIPVRFGNVPVDKEPIGYDKEKRFEKVYPKVSLPFQQIERVSFGYPELEPNKLFFGDNLHIMRMLPSKSIDLIYIDPPFFSGRNYNVLFGDKNELRSFSDIWEGGIPGYLIWLNARLYEMKRLLKDTGSIYVHLDWHASHYVKVEMDKIFGYDNFRNEIIWAYRTGGSSKESWSKKHDAILYYSKTKNPLFNIQKEKAYTKSKSRKAGLVDYGGGTAEFFKDEIGVYNWVNARDVWDISYINSQSDERIGYPTQKPSELLEKIIKASTNEGDIVADFFCGGGTTPTVAQKLGRKWIATDISRIAISLTADRLARQAEVGEDDEGKRVTQSNLAFSKVPDFTIDHWGVYEIQKLGKMSDLQFRRFIIEAYNGRADTLSGEIHGYKDNEPLYVSSPDTSHRISKEEVVAFATTILTKKGMHRGTILAWAFSNEARVIAEKMAAREGITLDFVKLNLIPIDSPAFKSHITDKHPTYSNLVSFILPPLIRFGYKELEGKNYEFDVSESTSMNSNGKIINVQWDFDYKNRFSSTQGYSFLRGKNKESLLKVSYEFPSKGNKKVACRVQDDLGGEATFIKEIEIKEYV